MHAADVAQTVSLILNSTNMIESLELEKLDVFSLIFSAIMHDFRHTGQGNSYHINKQTEIALVYNDISVLENYHIAETFRVLNKQNCNLLEKYSQDQKKLMRKRVVGMILATDMSLHTKIFTSLKLKVETMQIVNGENIDELVKRVDTTYLKFDSQQEIFNYTLHAADLSHNVKKFEVTEKWTNLLMKEFWAQGDLEKEFNLPISFNCDRFNTNVPKGQIGFLNSIIIPTFQLLSQIFPSVDFFVENAKNNIEKWNDRM
jgi:hypothetical protein